MATHRYVHIAVAELCEDAYSGVEMLSCVVETKQNHLHARIQLPLYAVLATENGLPKQH